MCGLHFQIFSLRQQQQQKTPTRGDNRVDIFEEMIFLFRISSGKKVREDRHFNYLSFFFLSSRILYHDVNLNPT